MSRYTVEYSKSDMGSFIQFVARCLFLCSSLIVSATRYEYVHDPSNTYRCVRPGVCEDDSGKLFRCVDKNVECCVNSMNLLIFTKAPRGETCCHGAGMFHEQIHECVKNDQGHAILNLRDGVISCPGTDVLYNPASQFCSTGPDGKTEALMLKDLDPYVTPTLQPSLNDSYKCVRSRVCSDKAENKFPCSEKNLECCRNGNNELVLSLAERGKHCCDGAGMYREQTHECVDGSIRLREASIYCPGTNMYYNSLTQLCCTDNGGETKVHMIEDGKVCCGRDYVQASNCCSGETIDEKTECCKAGVKVPVKECPILPTKPPRSRCPEQRECTEAKMEKRFKSYERSSSFMYNIQVGALKRETETHLMYKVKYCRQFIGANNKKIRTMECSMRQIGIPKCECPGELVPGENYVLRTRQKPRSKMILSRRKFYISRSKL